MFESTIETYYFLFACMFVASIFPFLVIIGRWYWDDIETKLDEIISFISDYKLKKSLPVWGKFRKLQKAFDVFFYYENEEIKDFLRMNDNQNRVQEKMISYESYFENVLEYLKVLKPSKSIEDQERFKVLKQDFRKVNDEIHSYVDEVKVEIRQKAISEFKNEKGLLND
ncbi:hypothetical protein [Lysinibacillus irui]|uniref:Uncharacterized protein n=1 Tax=Lysinibacillus irui TaxID=2998077 RepID=A0AAJ5RMU3_9BACI|nr:hypothetical protein [Lysinibacillus irui]WDV09332.1 hypothetical protein OU989_22680 [Lysinibacillus irui]